LLSGCHGTFLPVLLPLTAAKQTGLQGPQGQTQGRAAGAVGRTWHQTPKDSVRADCSESPVPGAGELGPKQPGVMSTSPLECGIYAGLIPVGVGRDLEASAKEGREVRCFDYIMDLPPNRNYNKTRPANVDDILIHLP